MIKITATTALHALTKVVGAEDPDFVYTAPVDGSCRYTRDGQGSCGVGRALLALGVPFQEVFALDYFSAYSLPPVDLQDDDTKAHPIAARAMGLTSAHLTEGAREVFQAFQTRQDNFKPWGEALNNARLTAANLPQEV